MKSCRLFLISAVLIGMLAAIIPVRADIALVDTAGEAGLSMAIAETGPASVTISNFTVSPMANVLVVLVEDKGTSALNSEPTTLIWGSQTILKAITQDNSDTTRRGSSIYYLFNPTPGTNNLTATVANSPADVEMTAYTLSGVDTAIAPKTGGVPVSGSSGSLTFNVPGVVAGSWAAVNSTWASTIPTPTITGTGGTAALTSLLVTTAGTSSIMTAGYISGLSGGTATFTATWSGSQKNNFAAAVFTPLATAINITAAFASPNPAPVGSNVLFSVTASSTTGSITSVVANARSIGGPLILPLNLSAGNVYTNSIVATVAALGAILPVTIQDNAGNILTGSLQVTVQTMADMQIDAFNKAFLVQTNDASRNAYLTYYSRSLNNRAYDGTWTFSLDIAGAEDAYERTHNPQQQQLINALCTSWLIYTPLPWNDGYNDDIGWFSLALVRGYQMTGNTNFLNAAEFGFNYAFNRGWDTNYNNGGIWEEQPSDNNGQPGKNPLACDSLLQTVCMIYQSTGDTNYLNRALQIYGWVRTNLFIPNTGLVCGNISTNGIVNTTPNLYNQGTFVDCANLLHNITGQQVYYDDALKAVEFTRNNLTVNGIFNAGTNLQTWAAEFARGLGHFVKDNNLWSTYYPWMQANANAAWASRRADYNISWNAWTQPTPTNIDMIPNWAVNAVAMTQATPASQPGLVNCTNQLHGTIIGTSGSWNNGGSTIAKVFDGNLSTYFDAPTGSVKPWAGLDFGVGVSNVIGQINYWPRATFSSRMLGGVFQGDNNPAFPNPVTLFTIATAPPDNNVVTPQTITNTNAFRCVRYVSADSSGNVAEIQFFSPNLSPAPSAPWITGMVLNGGNGLMLSATNGTPGGSWTLLQSTNVALPMSQWQTNIIGTFGSSGNLSTNLVNFATNSQGYYILKVQ